MKATDLVRVIDLMIPGACPEISDGPPVSLVRNSTSATYLYVAHYGALPPWWGAHRRLQFEMDRDDAVLIRWRRGSTKKNLQTAYQWLNRYGLDDIGRPRVWDQPGWTPYTRHVPELATAG